MAAPLVPWITNGEAVAGLGATTDIVNRPLRSILQKSGMDVDVLGFFGLRTAFSPFAFGAVGDGVTDDSAAIQACLEAARAFGGGSATGFKMPVVDFQGGTFAIATGLQVPGGYGMRLKSGRIVTTTGFTSGMYILTTGRLTDAGLPDGFRINNLSLREMTFDNRHVGGGVSLVLYNRVHVQRCNFFGYQTQGLKTSVDGHELFVSGDCQFAEYVWGDSSGTGYDHADLFVGTGIDLNTNDNIVTDAVIQLSKIGIRNNSQANLFSKCHIWPGYVRVGSGAGTTLSTYCTALYQTANGLYSSYDQMYFDGGEVIIEDPWETKITGSLFLNGAGDASRACITLKPMAAGRFVKGLVITGNSFKVNGGGTLLGLRVDTSVGTINGGQITATRFDDNSFSGVTAFYSKYRGSQSQSAATAWTFDLSTYFPIGAVQLVQMSAFQFSGGGALMRVASITGNVVVVSSYSSTASTTLSATNATVYLEADINRSM